MARVLSSWDEAKPGALAAIDAARAAKAESRKGNGVAVAAPEPVVEEVAEEIAEEAAEEAAEEVAEEEAVEEEATGEESAEEE